jgi:ATP-dependent Clp protease ATP-binding subunit ClpA
MIIGDMLRSDGVLARYTRDLTADARLGVLEPVRCRSAEIERVIAILLRHGKNNPTLVGPAGVGKTAIVEGFAERVAAGTVPLSLRGTKLLSLDHVSLLAGTTYRGQYEERIRGIVAEASADENVVLFIDELHNLIGQGTAMGVAMDAANMLKPALVRGEFRVIGATTDEEYDRWVCGDPALERRFQKVAVRELGAEETLEILQARKTRLEQHHNVVIADDALLASVRLTDRFITDRTRPDRALDALDEACAHAHANATYSPRTEQLILERRTALRRQRGAAERERATSEAPSPNRESATDEQDDPFERIAREGFAALERFGAELEAAFTGGLPRVTEDRPAASPASPPPPPPVSRPGTLAELNAELERRLVEEGSVVRPAEIARVVSLMSGKTVVWAD